MLARDATAQRAARVSAAAVRRRRGAAIVADVQGMTCLMLSVALVQESDHLVIDWRQGSVDKDLALDIQPAMRVEILSSINELIEDCGSRTCFTRSGMGIEATGDKGTSFSSPTISRIQPAT